MTQTPQHAAPEPRAGAREWAALAVLTVAVVLLGVDGTVLGLAIPALARDLDPSAAEILWIGDIYSFVLAGLLVTMGNVADRVGRRRLLLIGTTGFGLVSVMAAFAPSAGVLIAARALQGVFGATIMPSTLSLIRNIFPDPATRTTAIAVWGAGSTAGMAVGPALGGFLLQHYWWGSVFLINAPIMVLVLATGVLLLPESRNDAGACVDLLSSVLSIGAIMPLVLAVKTLAHDGLTLTVAVAAVVGLALGYLFLRRQRGLTEPLIDVSLFRLPAFTWSVLSNVIAIFAMVGLLYFFSQYLQLVREYSALRAGLAELPLSLASIAVVLVIGALVARLGQGRTIGVGQLLTTIGLAAFALAEGASSYVWLGLALALIGAGSGIAFTVATDAVLGSVPAERSGAASAISETGMEMGAALGIAVLGTVQDLGYRAFLGSSGHDAAAAHGSLAALSAGTDRSDAGSLELLAHGQEAFTHAMQVTASLAAVLVLLSAVMAFRHVPSPTGAARRATDGRPEGRSDGGADVRTGGVVVEGAAA